MVILIFFYVSAILISLGKGVADIVSDEPNWSKSIFSKYPIDSFWGCKDNTWVRKYRDNKVWNYLYSTILVSMTDIWHFSNLINKIGYYLGLVLIIFLPYTFMYKLLFILIHSVLTTFLFHIFYHKILRIKQ